MIDQILIPLDGSAMAEAAIPYAEVLPSQRVRLLQVEPDARDSGREVEAIAYLERVGEPLRRQGRAVETVFAVGDPADRIIAAAGDADLIVMTTRGRGAGRRALFGSVADRVARHAQAPTLLIRGSEMPAAPPRVVRVIVPLDGSSLAERALPVAIMVARDLGVPIHLLRVVELDTVRAAVEAGIPAARAYREAQEEARRQAEADLDAHVQQLRNQDVMAAAEVRTGSPAAELLDAINADDLVVMTTHGRGGVRRWFLGSVADKLVREAAAPVLLVRAGAPPSP